MDINYFNYDLPENLIAQTPLQKRDESKMLVLDKKTGEIEHKKFYEDKYLMTSVTLYYSNSSWRLPEAFIIEK